MRVLVIWFACRWSCLVLNSGRHLVLYESPHSFHRPYLSVHLSWTVENGHPQRACAVLIKVVRRLVRWAPEYNCLARKKLVHIFSRNIVPEHFGESINYSHTTAARSFKSMDRPETTRRWTEGVYIHFDAGRTTPLTRTRRGSLSMPRTVTTPRGWTTTNAP